jgi:hypothetical protein
LNELLDGAYYPEAACLCRRYGVSESVTYALVTHHARHAGLDEGLVFEIVYGFGARSGTNPEIQPLR